MNQLKQICEEKTADPKVIKICDMDWNHSYYVDWMGRLFRKTIEVSKKIPTTESGAFLKIRPGAP